MSTENKYYLGSESFALDEDKIENQEKLHSRLRQYLNLRNVSVLVGNGASIPNGSPSIGSLRGIIDDLDQEKYKLSDEDNHKNAKDVLNNFLIDDHDIGIEPLLGMLSHLEYDQDLLHTGHEIKLNDFEFTADHLGFAIELLKKWLFKKCKEINSEEDSLTDHKELLRRFLLRPTKLPRLNVFTTNYDLLLERALDDLGVFYFDGFAGSVKRTLRTETYNYDLYFPGQTAQGRVERVDRVLQFYKLHGSINWRKYQSGNTWDVFIEREEPSEDEYKNVMIYPSPLKMSEMHGYPYSEMFRNFASKIRRPQSVLFTVGYSFSDEHINRIIYQALSIPSFMLVIILPEFKEPEEEEELKPEHEIWRLINEVDSKRILVITGGEKDGDGNFKGAGTLKDFANKWLPDISELDIEEQSKEEALLALSRSVNDSKSNSEEDSGGNDADKPF